MPHVGPLIVVFGATGAQGGGLARAILADPRRRFRVRAVTRKPESAPAQALARAGAEVFVADLDDPSSVRRAMAGAYGAFCVTNFWEHFSPQKEHRQATTMAQAAKAERVEHVVWSTLEDTREFTSLGSGRLPVLLGQYNVPHYDGKGEANHEFFDRGIPTTLLYTSFFWDNLIHFGMQPQRGDDGRLAFVLPMGHAKLPGIAAADVGPCALGIFGRGDDLVGKSVGIAGEHLTGAEMAAHLSHALGEPVAHAALSPYAYSKLGFPGAEDLANMFAFKREFEHAYCRSRSLSCSRELHPDLMNFSAWLARNASRIPVAPRSALA
jgi:uncharacterized protein YbjT (DUF2867 family)